jgi:hypothetical protein
MFRVIVPLFLFFVCIAPTFAIDSLYVLREVPIKARLMTIDELGNVYVVRENNSLVRLNEFGDSTGFYRSIQNGDIGAIDATNPLSVVVYYPAYSKIVLLDRMLAQKNELDLRRLNILTSSVVASSADGNLWVYEPFNARLHKIDEQLNELGQTNDLRQEIQTVPSPSFMVERDRKVFMADTARGIFTFDRYGNYINTLSIFGVKYLQVFGSQLLYRHQDTLFSWDMSKVNLNTIVIPEGNRGVINATLIRSTLYVLYSDRLVLYRLKQD